MNTRVRGRVRVDHPKAWFTFEMREGGLTVWRRHGRKRYLVPFYQVINLVQVWMDRDAAKKRDEKRAAAWSRVSRKRDENQLPLIA